MSMRYQVRIRHPEHAHVFALRMNASRIDTLDRNTDRHRREFPPSPGQIARHGMRSMRPAVRLIERA
ncbi:MAG: hypothetical protein M9939_22195 [Mesorhizobium sp.]|nr:hypothetical protein [Mesorhizobium sp.]MCO5163848.1 hypothetical protein [Mesorhizobium sp.]